MTFDTMRDEGLTKGDLTSLLVQPLFAAALFWYGSHRLTIRQPFRFLTHFFAVSILVVMFRQASGKSGEFFPLGSYYSEARRIVRVKGNAFGHCALEAAKSEMRAMRSAQVF